MDPNKRPDFIGNRNIIDSAKATGANRFISYYSDWYRRVI